MGLELGVRVSGRATAGARTRARARVRARASVRIRVRPHPNPNASANPHAQWAGCREQPMAYHLWSYAHEVR